MATISIGDRTIHTRVDTDPSPQQAFERTVKRLYGANAWFKPDYDSSFAASHRWRDGGQRLDAHGQIFRSLGGGSSTALTDRIHVSIHP